MGEEDLKRKGNTIMEAEKKLTEAVTTENEVKKTKFKEAETITFAIYILLSIVMFVYHELWYDEIQAYMLAKDASFHELFFVATHYEGHPPLFALLLAIFAKTGVPMDVGLRIVSFTFSIIGAYLVIFKAPFKKIVRLLIPFTFFIFYQYTVICRPYSMMFAAFMLAACFYKSRNEKPFLYILSLFLLCCCSSYGMLFAGCFCLVWVVEIFKELWGKGFFGKLFKDKRFWSLVCILIGALFILYLIYPKENAFATNFYNREHPLRALVYTLFMMPADAMITDVGFFGSLQNLSYQFVNFTPLSFGAYLMSFFIHLVVYFVTYVHRKRRIYLLAYPAFAGFAAIGYMCNHHIGITVLFFVFLMWICYDDDKIEKRSLPKGMLRLNEQYKNLTTKGAWLLLILCMGMSLLWTGVSCFNDLTHEVWYAKSLNQVFEDYDLTDYRIVTDWSYLPIKDGKIQYAYGSSADLVDEDEEEVVYYDENGEELSFFYVLNPMAPEDYYQFPTLTNFADIIAYNSEGKNYISNFNDGDDTKRYIEHNCPTRDEATEYCKSLGNQGYPEIIIGDPNILGLMGLDVTKQEYFPIYEIRIFRPYKYFLEYQRSYVYLRKDLLDSREKWPINDQYSRSTLMELLEETESAE